MMGQGIGDGRCRLRTPDGAPAPLIHGCVSASEQVETVGMPCLPRFGYGRQDSQKPVKINPVAS